MASVKDRLIQIVRYNNEKKKCELNNNELESVLNSEDVRDANIAVVSISGVISHGKSFMLSLILRYLKETYINQREDWLDSDETRLSQSAWLKGTRPYNKENGIWIWSKVFTKVLPSGEKLGVMLMDTQISGETTRTRENISIFSFSSILSSIQIFNQFTNIKDEDLHHFRLLMEYGKLVLDQTGEKAFQTLLFLVRDWSFPHEAAYGFDGGQQILQQKLRVTDDQPDELVNVRKHLKSCYEKLDCFLMPNNNSSRSVSFTLYLSQLKDIDPEIKAKLREFVTAFLAPENVLPKKICGVKLNGRTLLTYIKAYWNIFRKDDIPTAQIILDTTNETDNLISEEEVIEVYDRKMRNIINDKVILQFGEMVELHNNIERQTLASKALMGDERITTKNYNKLRESLHDSFIMHLARNETIKKYLNKLFEIGPFDLTFLQDLKVKVEEYRKSCDAEKERLPWEIENLRRELACRDGGDGADEDISIIANST